MKFLPYKTSFGNFYMLLKELCSMKAGMLMLITLVSASSKLLESAECVLLLSYMTVIILIYVCVGLCLQYLMNAYSKIQIDNDISNASIDAKEQEAMCLWEAPDKNGAQPAPAPLNNTSALIR